MNGVAVIILCTVVWLVFGKIFDLSWTEVLGMCIVGCITGVLSFLFGAQAAQDPDIVTDNGEEAVRTAALAMLKMERLHSVCPYCHGPFGKHSDECLLHIARSSLVKHH